MAPRVGIIGAGGIAQALKRLVESRGWKVSWIGGRTTLGRLHALGPVDIIFLTISTLDKGECAREYIEYFVSRDFPVVTCEKGSWAYYPHFMHVWQDRIGYNAACGGGSELLKYLQNNNASKAWLVQAVINATLNFTFSYPGGVEEGFKEAQELHLVEPGSGGIFSQINGELDDVVRKTCVLWNTVFAYEKNFITPENLTRSDLTADEFSLLLKESKNYRYFVSFAKYPNGFGPQKSPGEFRGTVGRWHIKGGFQSISEESHWMPDGLSNAVRLIASGPDRLHWGPGAAHGPTTAVMLNDAYRLLYG